MCLCCLCVVGMVLCLRDSLVGDVAFGYVGCHRVCFTVVWWVRHSLALIYALVSI